MKVSIVFATARPGGFDILEHSIKHQTHEDLELIIIDELHREELAGDLKWFQDLGRDVVFVWPPAKKEGMFWNLSASLNAGVRAASGELIVLLQDYIYLPPDAISKYVARYLEEGPKCLITGVSDQFKDPAFIDNPEGDYSVWNTFPGPPSGEITFHDPRHADRAGFFVTIPLEWEANWGAFPKQAWTDVGGFDEAYDAGWGYDNCDFSDRCQRAGYRIFLDCDNPALCYSHILLFGEQKRREEAPNNLELYRTRERAWDKHRESWKLDYA